MSRIVKNVGIGCVVLLLATGAAIAQTDYDALATRLVEQAGMRYGVCSVVGAGDSALVKSLVNESDFLVHAYESNEAVAKQVREGLSGVDYLDRAVVEAGNILKLPYADNMVDLLVCPTVSDALVPHLPIGEIVRVVRPGGLIVLGALDPSKATLSPKALKQHLRSEYVDIVADEFGVFAYARFPMPAGMGDWSHWQHEPDNNPVSTDTLIKAPYRTRWAGQPYYTAMPTITTMAGGRIFLAMGHVAHHEREEKWLNTIVARNGFNGAILWTRKLPNDYLVHRSAFVATDDTYYLIDPSGDALLMLDPETGHEKDRVRIPGHLYANWKWIAIKDGVLYVLAGEVKDPDDLTVVRSENPHWGWGNIGTGYFQERIPWGFGETVVAFDLNKRKELWRHVDDAELDSRAMLLGDGRIYYYAPDAYAGCLEADSGKSVWRNSDEKVRELIEQEGVGLTSTPGFRTSPLALYTPDAIVFSGMTRQNLTAIATDDGRYLWHKEKSTNNPNSLYVDGLVYFGLRDRYDGYVGLDPLTGEVKKDLPVGKWGCTRFSATSDSFLTRGGDGFMRLDRETDVRTYNAAMRPGCTDGVIGANGLLYVGPWLCDCNLAMMGSIALCSAGDYDPRKQEPEPDALLAPVGPATLEAPLEVTDADWETYRGNPKRTGSSPAVVQEPSGTAWTYQPGGAFFPTAPVTAGGMVFYGGTDGQVRALDGSDGALRWSYQTAAPINMSPTLWDGKVYVGSSDGYVYCLNAVTGRLVWRFRAAPVERRIMLYGNLASAWPVNSGVMIADGVAYVAAGLIDYDGTYVYALDARTGDVLWRNADSSILDDVSRKGVLAKGALALFGDQLVMAGGNVISPALYDISNGAFTQVRKWNDARGVTNRGEEIGVLTDDLLVAGGRLQYSSNENVVNPGMFSLVGFNENGMALNETLVAFTKVPPAWDDTFFVMVDGKESFPQCLNIADMVTFYKSYAPEAKGLWPDQQRAREDRKQIPRNWAAQIGWGADFNALAVADNVAVGTYIKKWPTEWMVTAFNLEHGSKQWVKPLAGQARYGGLAIDRDGAILVALQDGRITCLR